MLELIPGAFYRYSPRVFPVRATTKERDQSVSERPRTTTAHVDTVPASQTIVEAVADATARETTDLEPLFDVLDPDALDALVGPSPEGGRQEPLHVSFRYGDCRVSVGRDGEVLATPEDEL